MKTQYFRRTKHFISPRQGIVAAAVVLVLIVLAGLRAFLPGAFVALATPLWNAGSFFTAKAGVPESRDALAARVAELTAENQALSTENHALAASATDRSGKGIRAAVIARPPLAPYDVLVLGAGSSAGVYAGMHVLSEGVPIGVVESVAANSSRVALYSAAGTATEGWIGEHHIPVTVNGLGAGAFRADVPREAGVAEGDAVYLPGSGAEAVGTVAKVASDASSPRATLSIRPAANPFTMTSVIIVASPAP